MLQKFREQAVVYMASHQLNQKRIPNVETAVLLMAKACELGMQPLTGLSTLYCVNGVVALQGQAMLQLIMSSHKVRVVFKESTSERAIVWMGRLDGLAEFTATWTIERAKASGITGNPTWGKYPAEMLRWRAIAECARMVASDIIGGCYIPEEFGVRNVDELTPRVVDCAIGSPVIGAEREAELADLLSSLVASGADRVELNRFVNRTVREHGAEKPRYLSEGMFDVLADGMRQIASSTEDDTEPLFPDGDLTTPAAYAAICDENGLDDEAQAALKLAAFGAARDPESPDEMAALIALTAQAIGGAE